MGRAGGSDAAVHCGEPGVAISAVAQVLAAAGFGTRSGVWEDRCLKIVGLSVPCEIIAADEGYLRWEYKPDAPGGLDAVTERVLCLLTGESPDLSGADHANGDTWSGLKGVVGRKLRERGMSVNLEIYEDQEALSVTAEILAVNPEAPRRGLVFIADDGALTWECGYCESAADFVAMTKPIAAIMTADLEHGCLLRSISAHPAPDRVSDGSPVIK
jgi:hypothetical protein